jgi:glycerophosphoryl diester phosphodiesterase
MEVFEAVGRRVLINIELKSYGGSPQLAQVVVDQIRAFSLIQRVLISSFSPFVLRHVRRMCPQLPIGYLYAPDLPLPLAKGWLARPVIGAHEARHPHFSMVDERYMCWARKNRYRVNVWTVNEPADIRRMIQLGVDMIISDYPDRVRDVLQAES